MDTSRKLYMSFFFLSQITCFEDQAFIERRVLIFNFTHWIPLKSKANPIEVFSLSSKPEHWELTSVEIRVVP